MKRILTLAICWIAAAAIGAAAQVQEGSATSESPTADEILDRTRDAWRGDSFHGILDLQIVLSGQTKSHVLEVWTLGEDLTLVRIHEPAEDAGSGYLEADGKLWYYSPLLGSAIELPAVALGTALFGSGPSLDDVSHGTLSDDYDVTVSTIEDSGYFLTLVPHPTAPVVYGKLELNVTASFVMERIVYYDQRGAVLRTASFSEVVDVDGRLVPTSIEISDAAGDKTIERVIDPEFDLEIDPSFFTVESLVGETE